LGRKWEKESWVEQQKQQQKHFHLSTYGLNQKQPITTTKRITIGINITTAL